MVRAGEQSFIPLLFQAYARAAVPADVKKGINLLFGLTDDNDGLVCNLKQEVVAMISPDISPIIRKGSQSRV